MNHQIMKFIAALAICLTLWSCNKDDNQTNPSDGSPIVSINTATLYDKLGITDNVNEMLAHGVKVTDSVLVYDQQGMLVARLGTESSSLQTVTISLGDLSNGTYTLVAWQTTSSGSDPFWPLVDAEQLATVHIILGMPNTINCIRAIGMYSTSVTIGSKTTTINADIEPMGSVVEFCVDGLTQECDYKTAKLYVGREEPAIKGFYLNPALSEEERWVLFDDRTEGDHPIGTVTPSAHNNKIFTFSHGENKAFSLYATNKTTDETDSIIDAVFNLRRGVNATFYFDLGKAGYQPPYCGLTSDFAAWKADRDAGILVYDPCLQWGANLQTVHNHVVSHHQWWRLDYPDLYPEEGHGWYRLYNIAKDFLEYYYFETESGDNLTNAICVCFDPTVPVSVANISLILQGYDYAGKIIYPDQPDILYDIFFSADGNTEVTTNSYEEGGWQIFYQITDPDDLALIIPVN